ncbi:adenosyl cobinamide kinase/adenosyl cobinamide phosphate guanylyltransferase [Actinokineospora baliensis]|uniref:bifunctional adenosylcobinamide kinase/adenosylcobinamide-phosphate guanylyltransferase n=1 Tax=Actinokineospora baliensis TaxID=547056 RepID=UPI0019571BBF|nr:bifunctional adenosylcobinamide kinase/adenosylcobinamide-phosphate guanylyltransferase [Actinokineospora baliensis]MBM7775604.1 adenosyl cobinamide kinase/adenosyl cobinamide phosphate guanylyltransferase [Actinokineospora baliensis]
MQTQPRRTLVLGGTRSGKSAHAEGLLRGDTPVDYLATARRDPGDAEWSARIAEHVARRPAHWRTVEVPATADLGDHLREAHLHSPPVLVDDIATWLTGALDDTGWDRATRPKAARDDLVAAVAACRARLVLVSAEVGLGVVPSTSAGRLFRDELGALNADLAEQCDEVLLLVAGIPMRLR